MEIAHQGDLVRIGDEEEAGYLFLSSGLRGNKVCVNVNGLVWVNPRRLTLEHCFHTPKTIVIGEDMENPVLEWSR